MLEDKINDSGSKENGLAGKIMSQGRKIFNIFASTFTHPLENTELDAKTGRIIRHYRSEENYVPAQTGEISNCHSGLGHYLKRGYLVWGESVLHPLGTSYINPETYEIKRE